MYLGEQLYGDHFCTSNAHSLVHLTSSAVRFRGLENISAFKYESLIGQLLKGGTQGGKNPLAQIVNRFHEKDAAGDLTKTFFRESVVQTAVTKVANLERDNFYQCTDGRIVRLMQLEKDKATAVAELYTSKEIFSIMEISSTELGKYEISPENRQERVSTKGMKKGLWFTVEDKMYFMLLIHKL